MAGRNDAAIATALEALAQAVQHQPNAGGNDGSRMLETFQRNHPPTFKGKHAPEGAQEWLKEVERIFRVMEYSDAQKRLEGEGTTLTCEVFLREFLVKYYPEDVRGTKEIEYLELKQGEMSVTEYAAKFVKLVNFYPHYSEETAEFSKCVKFENGLLIANLRVY
ncbi:uncharacterized protein LOC131613566 [Vicia villosa]|uniref:uncharacterized protein LOC131613566 n=1 Tax=Vicia villosa TaxID=3911 RepID=UPI00273BA749|nr:uncharacterized protein LOC131613566 [Vicia villosa]